MENSPNGSKIAKEMKVAEVKLVYQTKQKATDRLMVRSSKDGYDVAMRIFSGDSIEHRESLKVLLLNRGSKLLGVYHAAEGGISGCTADIRLIAQAALLGNASGVILAHNHPSGSTAPSFEDDNITRHTKEALKLFDINLLDHLIVTPDMYYSYADEGRI